MSAVLNAPLYREPVEFRAVDTQKLTIGDRGDGLFVIANGDSSPNGYIEFRGFFGTYGPEVFAAAPELLEALIGLMELESRGRIMPIGKEWDAARAAIAKASGVAS